MKNKIIYIAITLFLFIPKAYTDSSWGYRTDSIYWEDIDDGFELNYSPVNAYVMEIPLYASVSNQGAALVNVPLELPDIGKELAPDLALHYNSMQIETMFGNDWGLSGLSIIRRVSKSIYYDGIVQRVSKNDVIDGTEAFMINGNRLIVTKNNFPVSVSYMSEKGNIKVTAHLIRRKGYYEELYDYSRFEVFYPNGKSAVFGFEQEDMSKSNLLFPMTRISDRTGNAVYYDYIFTYGEYRVSKISFGKDKKATVEFYYKKTKIPFKKKVIGEPYETLWISHGTDGNRYVHDENPYEMEINSILGNISVKYDGKGFRDYFFKYSSNGKYIFLTEIHLTKNKTETTANANSTANQTATDPVIDHPGGVFITTVLKNDTADFAMPLRFRYGDDQTPTFNRTTEPLNYGYSNIKSKKGIFGIRRTTGIISFPDKEPYSPVTYSGDETISIKPDLDSPDIYNIQTGSGFIDVICADIDGESGYEIIKINNYISESNDILVFSVYGIDDSGSLEQRYIRTFSEPSTLYDQYASGLTYKNFFTGDFDGSGSNKILSVSSLVGSSSHGENSNSISHIFDLENNEITYTGNTFANINRRMTTPAGTPDPDPLSPEEMKLDERIYTGDFNGNGITDFLYMTSTGNCYLMEYNCNEQNCGFKTYSENFSLDHLGGDYIAGDFNGDGKTDLYLHRTNELSFSSGTRLWTKTLGIIDQNSSYNRIQYTSVEDMNNDGKSDLIVIQDSRASIYFFDEEEIVAMIDTFMIAPDDYLLVHSQYPYIEARKNELVFVNGSDIVRISCGINLSKALLLTGIKSSSNITTNFQYAILEDTDIYKTTREAVFPFQNLQKNNTTVVRKMYRRSGNMFIDTKSYSYENGITHRHGLGFCGFEKITAYDSIRGQSQTRTFDPHNFGVLKTIESPAQKTVNTYDISVAPNKIAKVLLKKSVQTDKLKGISQSKSYVYDSYDNLLTETYDFGSGLKQVTVNQYNNYTGENLYLLGELTNTYTQSYIGAKSVKTQSIFSYNNKGLPESKRSYYNGYKTSEETMRYDNMHNLLSVGIKSYNTTDVMTKTFEYDSEGKVVKETDPTGLSLEYLYNNNRQMYESKDIYGKITRYEYDNMGRLIKIISPFGSITTIDHRWVNLPDIATLGVKPPAKARYSVTTKVVDSSGAILEPEAVVYYDAIGRELRSEQLRFDGTWLRTDKQYDEYGRLQRISQPFKGSTATLWNSNEYDAYDRLTAVNYASGKKDTYSYSGNSVVSVVDGISKTTRYNNRGEVASVTDAAGTITYNYRADGQIESVSAPGGIVTSFKYDNYGRQTSITDPSAGQETKKYDAKGNIITQTDALGRNINYSYDEYNRPVKITRPEFTTEYTYNSYGNLVSETSSNGTSRSFTYDTYGRINTEQEYASAGMSLKKTYAYKSNKLHTLKYTLPNNKNITEYFIYKNGYCVEMKHNLSPRAVTGDEFPGGEIVVTPSKGKPLGPIIDITPEITVSFWKLTEENNMGLPVKAQTGSLTRHYAYDIYGYPTERKVENQAGNMLFNQSYAFSPATGNLDRRQDKHNNWTETFDYDNMNRLEKITATPRNAASYSRTMYYAPNGNIDEISDLGIFEYENSAGPYQISGAYPNNNNQLTQYGEAHNISYTSFRRPASVNQGDYNTTFTYNARGERVLMHKTHVDGVDLSKHYYIGGNYECDLHEEFLYLGGNAYTAPAVCRKENNTWEIYYICRDYQGSVCAITDSKGNKTAEYSYDAWGRLRNTQTMQIYTPGTEPGLFLGRGYTGHEHLKEYGLINMNARLYDPVVGRFLSPDPYIQDQMNSQNFNRYSYALNNPLKYTDPTGEVMQRYKYDPYRNTYIDKWGNSIDWTTAYLLMFENGCFRGGSVHPNGFRNGGYPDLIGNADAGEVKTGQDKLSEYIAVAEMLGVNITKGSVNANYAWLTFTYTIPPTNADMANNVLGTTVLQSFKFHFGNKESNLGLFAGVLGAGGNAISLSNSTFRLENSKGFSPKLYTSGWAGGSRGNITTYSVAKLGRGISTGAGALSTGIAYVDIFKGNTSGLTYTDAAVGTTALANSFAGYLGFAEVPVIGQMAALYGWARLWMDIGYYYGPSHWYGTDNTKWFK